MFDTFMGLPIHILVSHFTVVLIPLAAIATIVVPVRPAWRAKYLGPLAALNVAMLALTFVTVRAGEDLKDRYRAFGDSDTPKFDHEEYGKTLLWVMVALAVVSALAWAVAHWRGVTADGPAVAVMGLTGVGALVALASVVLVVMTGHTGAKSQWEDFVKSSDKQLAKHKQ